MQKTYIGADLGGTKLLIGEMNAEGNLLRSRRYPSGPLNQRQALELFTRSLDEFLSESIPDCRPAAIGVGLLGRIDSRTGTWFEISPAVPSEEMPLGRILSERYGLALLYRQRCAQRDEGRDALRQRL